MIAALCDGSLARALRGARGNCPECHDPVYARVPEGAIRHWAHVPLPDGQPRSCSRDAGEMSEWHRAWQAARTDLSCIEVARGDHRADAITPSGLVVEFQRSHIAPEDIADRERFWRRGVWVLDGTGDRSDGNPRVEVTRRPDQSPTDPWRSLRWRNAPLLLHRAKWPQWIDLGADRGLVQVRDWRTDNRGNGWQVTREWFVSEVINGDRALWRAYQVAKRDPKATEKRRSKARAESDNDLVRYSAQCGRTRVAELSDVPCCGEHPVGVAGAPIVLSCKLCPTSPIYWRGGSG